jgi:Mlc titration factor MtfA (ptsG expression regulator)
MLFSWLKRRRRRRLWEQPFPAEWEAALVGNVAQFGWLEPDEQQRLRGWIQVFVAETYWEGLAGLEVTDEMRVTIAAQVGFQMLGFEEDYLEHLQTILIHPHIEPAPR